MRRTPQHRLPAHPRFRALLAGAVVLTLGVGSLVALGGVEAPAASANTPGVPGAPTVVYGEDFSAVPSGGAQMLNLYVSSSPTYVGGLYDAANEYKNRAYCNGLIMTGNTPSALGYTVNNACNQISRALAQAMGVARGETLAVARQNAALTDVTVGGAPTPANGIVMETVTPIPLSTGRFLAVKLLAAALNCHLADKPAYVGYLVDGVGNELRINATPINPCTDPAAVTISQPELGGATFPAKVLNVASDQSILVTTSSAKFRVRNAAVGGTGNDAATDDIQLIDVSPTLDKQFSPTNIGRGQVGTMVFTVTNTSELASKNGFEFTENLPGGLTIAPTPNFTTTCNNGVGNLGVITSGGTAGATSVGLRGSLATDQVSCTFKIDVLAPSTEGPITNSAANVDPSLGLKTGDTLINGATVGVRDPRLQVTKELAGDRVHAGDQFTVELRQGSANGAVVNDTTNSTTAGSAASVTAGTGTTGVYQGVAGSTYYIGESAAGTTLLGQYLMTITCTDSAGLQQGLPEGVLFTGAFAITPVAGANISCTLRNRPQTPGIELAKRVAANTDTDGSGNVTVGDQVTYAFDLTNTGSSTLSTIAVTDPTLGTVTCPQPSLAAGASETCTAGVRTVTQADIDAGSLSNTATVTANDPAGDTLTKSSSVTISSPGVSAVALSKTESSVADVNGNSLRDAGDRVTWAFIVKNTGSVTLTNPTVADSLAGVTVTCPSGSLAPGASVPCTQNAPGYALTQADVNAGGVTNSATASARNPQNAIVTSPTATVTSSADQSYALSLTKSEQAYTDVNGSTQVDAGDTISWVFAVQNTGTVPVSNLTINDQLLTDRNITVTCPQTTLAPGASTTCTQSPTFTIQPSDVDSSDATIQNTATARGTRLDGATLVESAPSGTSRVLFQQASISMVKSAGAPVDANGNGITDAGDTVLYSFAVTNDGTVTLTDPVVTDAMLANANPAITINCPTSIAPSTTETCTASGPYTITQADVDASGGALTNSASVTASTPSSHTPPSVTSSGTGTSTSLSQATSLGLTKSAALTDVNGNALNDTGDRVDYTFVITNTGARTLTNVALDDPLLAGAGSTITCGASTLASNASTTCTASYTITANDMNTRPGSLDNSATASGFSPSGTKVTSPAAAARVQLDQVQGFQVTSSTNVVDTDGDGQIAAGDQVQYTFTMTNSGSQTMDGVTVTSPQFTSHGVTVTCTPTTLAPGQTATCTATLTITQADVQNPAGLVVPVSPQGTPPGGSTAFTGPSTDVVTPLTQTASMTLDKRANLADTNNSGRTDAGDQITYSFTVTSTGTETITNLQLNDPMLTGISCPSTLPAGGSVVCTAAPYTVQQSDVQTGSVNNTATVTGTDIHNATVTATDSATVVTPGTSGINLVKRVASTRDVNGNGVRDAGDGVTFAFDVTNSGTLTLTNPGITDAFLTAAGITPTCGASIAPGATLTCTAAEYLMTQADVDAGGVTNTATANADSAAGPVTSSPSTVVAPADRVSALVLTKTAVLTGDVNSNGTGDVDDTVTWSFSVHNGGTVAVSNVTIDDQALEDRGITATCPASTIPPGGDLTCSSHDYIIQQPDVDAGTGLLINEATASATPTGGGTVTSPTDGTSTPLGDAASLDLQKNVAEVVDVNGNGVTDAGDTIKWSFVVTNNGNLTASGITVNDPFVTAAGLTVTCPQASLGQGGTETCTMPNPYVITQDDVDSGDGTITNTATASATSATQTTITSPASGTDTIVVQSAALSMVKDSTVTDVNQNGYTDAGDTIVYTFDVENTGTQTVSSIAIDDPMLAGAGVTISCPSATLAPGATQTCTSTAYTVTQGTMDASTGTLENSATSTGRSPSNAAVDSQAGSHSVPLARIGSSAITKTATVNDVNTNGKTDAGDTVSYTFTVQNTGSLTLTNVAVVDPMLQAASIAVTCDTTTLAPGASANCTAASDYLITQAMMDGSGPALLNSASATATDPDGATVTTGASATTSTTFTQDGALTLTKHGVANDTNGNSRTDAGDTVSYTFDVLNSGTLTIDNISVSDPMLTGQGISVTCLATTLAPGASTTCSASGDYVITQGTVDGTNAQLTNAASVTGEDQQNRTVTSTEATATTNLTQLATLSLVKTETSADTNGNGKRDAGDSITYSFEVRNNGTQTIDDLEITDPLLTAANVTPICPTDMLVPGDVVTCTAAYTITQADVDASNTSLANTANAAGTAPAGGPVVSPASTANTAITHQSEMTLDIESHLTDRNGDGKAGPGDDLSWTITVTNTGTTTLGDLQFQSELMRERGLTVTCNPETVAPGEKMICTVSPLTLTNADAGKQITLDLTASAHGGDVAGRISDSVSAAPIGVTGPILAATGFAVLPGVVLGLSLLALGFLFLAVQARRRQRRPELI